MDEDYRIYVASGRGIGFYYTGFSRFVAKGSKLYQAYSDYKPRGIFYEGNGAGFAGCNVIIPHEYIIETDMREIHE